MIRSKATIAAFYTALTLTIFGGSPLSAADPDVDVTKNPGCGVKGLTREQKIARNQRLAEYYFQGWSATTMAKHGHQYRFNDHDCFAKDATFRMGFGLQPEPPEFLGFSLGQKMDSKMAPKAPTPFNKVIPDWGTIPGTLRVYPSENGAYFIMRFGGTAPTGERIEYWETDYIVVDDDGKITHWEGYNDTMGVDRLFRVVFGKGVKEVGSMGGLISEATKPNVPE